MVGRGRRTFWPGLLHVPFLPTELLASSYKYWPLRHSMVGLRAVHASGATRSSSSSSPPVNQALRPRPARLASSHISALPRIVLHQSPLLDSVVCPCTIITITANDWPTCSRLRPRHTACSSLRIVASDGPAFKRAHSLLFLQVRLQATVVAPSPPTARASFTRCCYLSTAAPPPSPSSQQLAASAAYASHKSKATPRASSEHPLPRALPTVGHAGIPRSAGTRRR